MKKIYDIEEFKKMWMSDEKTTKEIADHFDITRGYVHIKRADLGLPPKGTRGFGMAQRKKREAERNAQNILKYLKDKGGFSTFQSLNSQFPISAIEKLKHQRQLFVVRFQLGRGTGVNVMRRKQYLIFKEPYIGKSFACDSRTAVIRLMFQALRRPETGQIQKTVTNFLKQYLTNAERYAVMWQSGKHQWSRCEVKSSIQIDGIVKARKLIPSSFSYLSLNSS